eukprot:CAMPEP_0181036304 /NCGR_PEP_ID=MMETSP1070-20121207/8778_1 /TAXON_ID=265543 /ORGANISM="Minutocellus polymorphus, Strain NH13" /LENGTH=642 /DNA_ID=CAMNT_0023113907 /DNA_START=18 /DNA_END=1948 /DNA_ORIENTATION=+
MKDQSTSLHPATAAADRQMEQRAERAKELLSSRYKGLRRAQERKAARRLELEQRMTKIGIDGVGSTALTESQKSILRSELARGEVLAEKESRRKLTTSDFEPLVVVGRGAFGEVALVRSTSKSGDSKVFALKSMKKEFMRRKNQTHHIRAEREALSMADDRYQWLTHLHCSFQDESNLYMVMDFMPGGDLMGLLIREDTFCEGVTRYFMAEAAHAISAIHALGYIHRDIKPDNFLIDARGHLKLTDLGLCKRVGAMKPEESPTRVLKILGKTSNATSPKHNYNGDGTSAPSSPHSCITAYAFEDGRDCDALSYSLVTSSFDNDDESDDDLTGLSHLVTPEQMQDPRARAKTVVGTPDYIAPEVLATENGGEPYDSSVDGGPSELLCMNALWVSYVRALLRMFVRLNQCSHICSHTSSWISPSYQRPILTAYFPTKFISGYPPFYSSDPVGTCRKILRWRETLRIPSDRRKTLSRECIDFLSCLMTDSHMRIGSSTNPDSQYGTNGFAQIANHPFYNGFDWDDLGRGDGPLLPHGSNAFPRLLEELQRCPRDHPRFQRIIGRITVNFDSFDLDPEGWYVDAQGGGDDATAASASTRVSARPTLDEFYDYSFSRRRQPEVPCPHDHFDHMRDTEMAKRMEEMVV